MSASTFTYSGGSGYSINLPLPSAIAHPKIRERLEDLIAKEAMHRQAEQRVRLADQAHNEARRPGRAEDRASALSDGAGDLDELNRLATEARTEEADAKAALVEAREVSRMANEVTRRSASQLVATIEANEEEWRAMLIAEAAKARDKMANGLRAVENAHELFGATLGLVEMLDQNRLTGDNSKMQKRAAPGHIVASEGIASLRRGFGLLADRVDRA